jgi:hypothetical protein
MKMIVVDFLLGRQELFLAGAYLIHRYHFASRFISSY